ncbi:hypothetical protein [Methanobrevibacter sp. DSM 116169]|uniref:hypothetical protein n=1 Tax=Methanobrevibacter sp. DSM 116169 TaxID=3242727 RepID=UPI0038FBFB86
MSDEILYNQILDELAEYEKLKEKTQVIYNLYQYKQSRMAYAKDGKIHDLINKLSDDSLKYELLNAFNEINKKYEK